LLGEGDEGVSTVVPAESPEEQWGHVVPVQSQKALRLPTGETTLRGCAPTAVSMVLDYWHAQDPRNPTRSAQDLLDENVGEGVFHSGSGMSPEDLFDELGVGSDPAGRPGLGYHTVQPERNAGQQRLVEAVRQGPVVAVVKLDAVRNVLATSGETHSVVVTGISPDGTQVRINDPWTGQSDTYPWEDFSASWGADFGRDDLGREYARNSFAIIRP
jgi:hypothetical protein